jgi:hypothetical protein
MKQKLLWRSLVRASIDTPIPAVPYMAHPPLAKKKTNIINKPKTKLQSWAIWKFHEPSGNTASLT